MTFARLFACCMLTLAACHPSPAADTPQDTAEQQRARQDSINRAQPGYVVDSILPVEEEVRRFAAAIGGPPVVAFDNASASRDELVQRFTKAVAKGDSAALSAMTVHAREFVDLIYPESPYTHAPYRQAPGLLWMQIVQPSASGQRRLLRRLGGRALHIDAVRCAPTAETQGRNRLWAQCTVRYRSAAEGGSPRDGRLFGTIIERDGVFKFLSLSNQY